MNDVSNIYDDEQKAIDEGNQEIAELQYDIASLLDVYGYSMEPQIQEGVAVIEFIKNT